MVGKLPPCRDQQRGFWRLVAAGVSTEGAGEAVGVSAPAARRWFGEAGGMAPLSLVTPASGRYLSVIEREEIALELAAGRSVRAIAVKLGRAPSTISREVARNRVRDRYSPSLAQEQT